MAGERSPRQASVLPPPAEIEVALSKSLGIFNCPAELLPQATSVPSLLRAPLWNQPWVPPPALMAERPFVPSLLVLWVGRRRYPGGPTEI